MTLLIETLWNLPGTCELFHLCCCCDERWRPGDGNRQSAKARQRNERTTRKPSLKSDTEGWNRPTTTSRVQICKKRHRLGCVNPASRSSLAAAWLLCYPYGGKKEKIIGICVWNQLHWWSSTPVRDYVNAPYPMSIFILIILVLGFRFVYQNCLIASSRPNGGAKCTGTESESYNLNSWLALVLMCRGRSML